MTTMTIDPRLEEQCKHGFPTPIDCPICDGQVDDYKPSRRVWRSDSSAAERYHSRPDCPGLHLAQAEVEEVSEDSVKGHLTMCSICFDEDGRPR